VLSFEWVRRHGEYGVGRFDRLVEVSVCCEYVAHYVDRLDSERPKALMITVMAIAYVECD